MVMLGWALVAAGAVAFVAAVSPLRMRVAARAALMGGFVAGACVGGGLALSPGEGGRLQALFFALLALAFGAFFWRATLTGLTRVRREWQGGLGAQVRSPPLRWFYRVYLDAD